ncbi:hypothetical protein KR084_006135 [Drosophila pseudotakahashii]|nr:hypothetical protein KR084_006135 [Drosophila pseudotakahashii]
MQQQQQQPSIDQLSEPIASTSSAAAIRQAAAATSTTSSTSSNFHQQLQATTAATMQRLRTTFTRSRTPTGAEMKMQNSLEVPKQVRSASFDEMQLESQRASSSLLKQQSSSSASADERSSEAGFLQVPLAAHQQRSHSFDSATASGGSDDSGTFLEVPRRLKARRSSSTKTPPPCIHCHYLEEYERRMTAEQRYFIDHRELTALSYSNTSSENSEDEDEAEGEDDDEASSTAIEDAEEETTEAATEEADEDPRTEVESEHDHDPDDDAALEMDIRIGNMSSQGSSIEESRARLPRQMRRHTIGSSSLASATSEDEGLEGSDNGSPHFGNTLQPPATPCGITFTLSPTNGDYPSPPHLPLDPGSPPMSPCSSNSISGRLPADADDAGAAMGLPVRARRRSISRQEAIFVEPTGNSLENVSHEEVDNQSSNNTKSSVDTADSLDEASTMATCGSPGAVGGLGASTSSGAVGGHHSAFVVRDIYLMVPDLKRDRAASVDSCFSKLSSGAKTEELQPSADGCFLTVPNINATRSRSVDIVLPTDEQARYKALSMTGSTVTYADGRTASASNSRRPIRIVPDWTENAVQGEHYWKPTSASGDLCCLNEECIKSGQRMKCSACQLVAHHNCIPFVNEKSTLACKPTYRDVGIRQYREQTTTHHHWVHRKLEKGKCKQCGKFFPMKQAVQSKLFGSKEIVALACAWCHEIYHNKEACFNQSKIGEECRLGEFVNPLSPPLPAKGHRPCPYSKAFCNILCHRQPTTPSNSQWTKLFSINVIAANANVPTHLADVYIKRIRNEKKRKERKGNSLPRQLCATMTMMILDMFRKAPNLRVLACGGDGTVGWVLSVLDQIQPPLQPVPAVGVLPLGTGNDLARALGWGGSIFFQGYTDEPIGKILREIGMSQCVLMDRWRVKVTPNDDVTDDHVDRSKANVPLNVINNYFSFGVDAHIALEFHEAREAHPERFNSRLRNKMYYGQMGGKDLILRQYRNLSQWVTLECDGQDFTGKLRDAGCHAVLFLNIPSYGGGTHPWNDSFGASKPSIDDGLMEVVGLTTYQLPMLQAGMHGTCICQCRKARIITKRTIPMQVDGEACRVKPSVIEIELLNKALMLSKRKHGRGDVQVNPLEKMQLNILRVTMQQYEQYHYDKEMLRKLANKLGQIEIESQCDLEHVRNMLNTKFEESISYPKVSQDWCFIDSCTAEHYFRIDRAQEHLHYICDIAIDELYILDHEAATMPQTPDQERSFAAFSQRQAQNERRQLDQAQGRGPGSTDEDLQIGSKPIKVMKWKSPILEQTSDAILLAAQSGDLNMLRALHEQGYSLQSVNKNGQTALHFACKYNHRDIVKYIIASATRRLINMADKELGQTALHIAAEQNRRDICVMLVAAGAHLDTMDSGGNTPMMVAFNKNANEIATYLESKQGTQPVDGWLDD